VPREVVALVSADDAVAAIRVHADRVHDLLRRSGCGPQESVEVTESYAFALIDAIVNAPETVGDMAGWWFGRALELGRRLGGAGDQPPEQASTSVLAGTEGEAQVRAALATLPESERDAVLLRDGYDLPPQAVAVALRREPDAAAALVALGRLSLVSRYVDRRPPSLADHTGRTPADLATLSQLADGTLPVQRSVALRRHLQACVACEDTVDMLAKGRRLAAGLPVIAMPDEAREAMLQRVTERATSVLPSVDEVLLAVEEDDDTRPAISPITVVLAIVAALVLGVGVAALTRSSNDGAGAAVLQPVPTLQPTLTPSFSVAPTTSTSATTSPRRTTTPTTVASRTATARPTRSSFVVNPAIVLSPTSGPRGTTITVSGSGWQPGDEVTVRYTGPVSSTATSAFAGPRGNFRVTVTADGLVPADYVVRALGGSGSATASFRQTS
jgi:hypothetical protein